jgi:predicted nucleic acid-binding protein
MLYLLSEQDPGKREAAARAMNGITRVISTQVINEICNVCLRKLKYPVSKVEKAVIEIYQQYHVSTVTRGTELSALRLHERYRYSYYDCLMLASALENNCTVLFSEDMADGQLIGGRLTIRNIFA